MNPISSPTTPRFQSGFRQNDGRTPCEEPGSFKRVWDTLFHVVPYTLKTPPEQWEREQEATSDYPVYQGHVWIA